MNFVEYIRDQLGSEIDLVEIGSYTGESTEIFAVNFAVIHAVDPWQGGYDENDPCSHSNMSAVERKFDRRMKKHENVIKMKCRSEEAVHLFPDKSLDVVYIDAEHTFESVKQDITLWLPKIKSGGFIAGHDYDKKYFPGVYQAVNTLLGKPQRIFEDTSWLVRI